MAVDELGERFADLMHPRDDPDWLEVRRLARRGRRLRPRIAIAVAAAAASAAWSRSFWSAYVSANDASARSNGSPRPR